MNLLAFSGSLRAGSFNTALLRAAQGLAPDGVSITLFSLRDLPFFDQDLEAEGDPAAVVAWKEAVRAADGLLIACPEYNGGVTGVLKNAVDWASRGKPAPLAGKRCCVVGASPGMTGTVRAQDALRLSLRRAGARAEPQGDVLVGQAHAKIEDGILTDERTIEALRRHLAEFVEILRG
ncbi:FMN reductase [Caulobacter flavus]|jgi:chromate reductase|uniref:FMN reductase n=1 Tax=Caulobacter flavus TaxID=1679497 RepID=A0A2N5CSG2_9CAUL|nr:NADPH-dependent FMN reductase [Caulobacter flavus]AYV49011.1 FMN reductase [Caulobacter flavus]PLR13401.1 FMN reductase [Caulobacter flavus]